MAAGERGDAFAMCREFIGKHLRDPNSADYLDEYRDPLVGRTTTGEFRVFMRVRANNGLGGKNVSTFDCTLRHGDGEMWYLTDLRELSNDGGSIGSLAPGH